MKCPRCQGKGFTQITSFRDPALSIDARCRICKGSGVLEDESETRRIEGVLTLNGDQFLITPIGYQLTESEMELFKKGKSVRQINEDSRNVLCSNDAQKLGKILRPFIGKKVAVIIGVIE